MSRTPRSTHPLKATALGGAALAALVLGAYSGGGSRADDSGSDRLRAVATTTQLADFARQVGGDDIELTGLLAPGGSAHRFDPTPADLVALGEAEVLIANGAGLEGFIDSAVEASGFDGEIVTASESIDPGPDPGEPNPHIWTSPRNAARMVSMIAGDLARIDPERADGYAERADAYAARLDALDAWIAAQFERVPAEQRVLVSGHDSLGAYLDDYGIEFVGSMLPSFEDNAEPSAADVDALVASIEERGVRAVFVESSMSPKLARAIAREAGVEVADAGALYADSLGAPGSDGATYIGATAHNTRVILEAWGATVDPLPAPLRG
ncbi:metal ABC transporter substrate-binding protein [Leucobacter sp. wl10]|uniref:metal ABC transporter substrate-binding protein n=1 Tax=Leucobacter sp. wl10 TaxID=2304677 RepID=UPI000E5BABA5|nr:metal ABC transporter substrate-binding protein [Leucobacter sp. wl10]RGE20726.1 zinc ABC transporter substrate-binding protein [Leucobacter sp. wl10]